jgi:hypothetical protein
MKMENDELKNKINKLIETNQSMTDAIIQQNRGITLINESIIDLISFLKEK